mgnify:CR=1 FL=1
MLVLLYRLYHAVSCCIVLYHLPKKEIFVLYQLYQYCILLYRGTHIVLLYQYGITLGSPSAVHTPRGG